MMKVKQLSNYINGEWIKYNGELANVINPATGEPYYGDFPLITVGENYFIK